MQVDETAIIEDANNRYRWRGLVEAAKGLNGLQKLKKKNYNKNNKLFL